MNDKEQAVRETDQLSILHTGESFREEHTVVAGLTSCPVERDYVLHHPSREGADHATPGDPSGSNDR
jgi:hypothetical protein